MLSIIIIKIIVILTIIVIQKYPLTSEGSTVDIGSAEAKLTMGLERVSIMRNIEEVVDILVMVILVMEVNEVGKICCLNKVLYSRKSHQRCPVPM